MYEIVFLPRAVEDLNKLEDAVASQILKKMRWLAQNFDSIKPESLKGQLAGLLKLRDGDYRVIYQ